MIYLSLNVKKFFLSSIILLKVIKNGKRNVKKIVVCSKML